MRTTRAKRLAADLCTQCGKEPPLESSELGKKCTKLFVERTREYRRKNKPKVKKGSTWSERIKSDVARARAMKSVVQKNAEQVAAATKVAQKVVKSLSVPRTNVVLF